MEIISLIIGSLGLIMACITFFLTQISKPKIKVFGGPEITIYYPRDGGFGMYLPLSFINDSKRGGKVISIILTLKHQESKERFNMNWQTLSNLILKREDTNIWIMQELFLFPTNQQLANLYGLFGVRILHLN